MRRILLDTSAYSAALRGDAGAARAMQEADEVCLTPIVLGELRAGFLGGARARENEAQLRAFLAKPRVRVPAVDEDTAERYALVRDSLRRAGTPIPANDIWIAASALQHGLRIVTADAHFARVPLALVQLLEPPAHTK